MGPPALLGKMTRFSGPNAVGDKDDALLVGDLQRLMERGLH